jgi:hypothetical protein
MKKAILVASVFSAIFSLQAVNAGDWSQGKEAGNLDRVTDDQRDTQDYEYNEGEQSAWDSGDQKTYEDYNTGYDRKSSTDD